MSFEVGALLEPLGVAIHACRRAKVVPGSKVLVFGAGAVGLLCAAMSKVEGAGSVVVADVQEERVRFAVENGFAHGGFVVPRRRREGVKEKLVIARETAALAAGVEMARGQGLGEVDTVFECTGVEACTQAAIYVMSKHEPIKSPLLTTAGDTCRWESRDCRYGESRTDIAHFSRCAA